MILKKYREDHSTAWKSAGKEYVANRQSGKHIQHGKGYAGVAAKWNETLAKSPRQRKIAPSSLRAAVDCGDFGISPN